MNKIWHLLSTLLLIFTLQITHATPDRTQLAVWANEAIIATYTFDYQNFLTEQKDIAKYFTAEGWIAYSKALNDSKLPDAVQKNAYKVTAVATQPPHIVTLNSTHWQAIMTILVVYTNPQYQQKQNLLVVLDFTEAPTGQGVRGLSATSLQATATTPPCQCTNDGDAVK